MRDVQATTMNGGGFAVDGDLTLGGIGGAQVKLLDLLKTFYQKIAKECAAS